MPLINRNNKIIIFVLILLMIPFTLLSTININTASNIIKYELQDKSGFKIMLETVDTRIKAITADPLNELVLRVEIRDAAGVPVPEAKFKFNTLNNIGNISPTEGRTGPNGSILVTYRPPAFTLSAFKKGKIKENISVSTPGLGKVSSLTLELVRVPVVFIHGYKAAPSIFNNFKDYLQTNDFSVKCLSYNSEKGVAFGAAQLGNYLDTIKAEYLNKGIQVKRFDLVAHSMGGLVARYYTCDSGYIYKNNVEKIIFISVPHNGSPMASLGLKFYNDHSISDLIPDSSLFTKAYPTMINRGLNSLIQVGNILSQYDEVVSYESASLDEWGIKTELFNVGESNFTLDNILNGKIIEAANHKEVLYNKKVFQRTQAMLETEITYPKVK